MSDAPERIGLVANPFGYSLWNSVDYDDPEIAINYVRADIHKALVKERDEALEELGRVIMACPPGFRKSPASEGVKELRAARDTLAAANAELRRAAERVVWFDWSDNDPDAASTIDALREALARHAAPAKGEV